MFIRTSVIGWLVLGTLACSGCSGSSAQFKDGAAVSSVSDSGVMGEGCV